MDNSKHILHGYKFDNAGGAQKLLGAELDKSLKDDVLAWAHLDAGDPAAREWLEENTPYLDRIIIDALLAEETRPRFVSYKDGVLVILRGVNLNEGMEPEDMISIRLWVDEKRIVSLQRRRLRAVEDIASDLEAGRGPKNAGSFLAQLVRRLTVRMEPFVLQMDEACDDAEEAVLDNPDVDLRRSVVDIRRQATVMRRYIVPQREVVSLLRGCDVLWLKEKQKRALQESYDAITRYVEELDVIRERAQIVKDELANIMSEKMNRNTYVLSIVATIFLPLGFLTGLLGINVGGMPGAESDVAFWAVCLLCSLFAASLLLLFRFMKWF